MNLLRYAAHTPRQWANFEESGAIGWTGRRQRLWRTDQCSDTLE